MDIGLLEKLEIWGFVKGKCFVIGGGWLDWEIYEVFWDLVGGDSVKVVIIFFVLEDCFILRDGYNKWLKIFFEKVGLKNIIIFYICDCKMVDSDFFVVLL